MFKKFLQTIKQRKKQRELLKQKEQQKKFFAVRGEIIKFYEDKDLTSGVAVEIPAFMRADRIMKQVIKTPKDLDFYYNKLLKYKAAA